MLVSADLLDLLLALCGYTLIHIMYCKVLYRIAKVSMFMYHQEIIIIIQYHIVVISQRTLLISLVGCVPFVMSERISL